MAIPPAALMKTRVSIVVPTVCRNGRPWNGEKPELQKRRHADPEERRRGAASRADADPGRPFPRRPRLIGAPLRLGREGGPVHHPDPQPDEQGEAPEGQSGSDPEHPLRNCLTRPRAEDGSHRAGRADDQPEPPIDVAFPEMRNRP